jgi:hypothetical protein
MISTHKSARLIDDDPTLRGKRELLTSIPGIGERLAVTILGELPNLSEFRNAKAVAAFTGLCPREFRSGKSVSASWLSKDWQRPSAAHALYAGRRSDPLQTHSQGFC